MATAISSGSGVRWCCSSTAVLRVHRWSGLVDVAPELFWTWTIDTALYTVQIISIDLIVTTHVGKSLKHRGVTS